MGSRRYLEFAEGRLQRLLDEQGWSATDLAQRMGDGLTPTAVRNWLRGDSKPHRTKLSSFLRVFNKRSEVQLLDDNADNMNESSTPSQQLAGENPPNYSDTELEDRFDRFHTDYILPNEVDTLRGFAVKHMGGAVAQAETLKGWLTVNPRIFFRLTEVVHDGEESSTKLVGYFSLRPITSEAIRLLDAGIIDGAGLLPEHILEAVR